MMYIEDVDNDFSDLYGIDFDDLDGPTESERPARKSRLDEIEIDDSEGLRAIVEAECAENDIVISYDDEFGHDYIDAAHRAYMVQSSNLLNNDPDWDSKFRSLELESKRIGRLADRIVRIRRIRNERDSVETIECHDGDHVLTDVAEVPVYDIKVGDHIIGRRDMCHSGTVRRTQAFSHGHRLTVEHESGNVFYTTSVEAFRVVR